MKRLFSLENPLMRFLVKVFDCIALSVLWVVFSLPIFTLGAASTALYSSIYRHVRLGESYLWKSFWEPFKENFKRSTLAWLPMMATIAFFIYDVLALRMLIKAGHPLGAVYGVILVLLCVSLVWAEYLFAYCARFQGKVKDVLRFSFYLLMAHPLRSLGVMAAILGSIALILMVPGLAILLPAGATWLSSLLIEKVFLKHMSEEDAQRTIEEQSNKD